MPHLNWGDFDRSVAQGKSRGKRSRRFQIGENESVTIRLLTSEHEPFIFKRHYSNAVRRYLVCADDAARAGQHSGCVACAEARRQGKNGTVRGASRVYAFSVYDPRKYHWLEDEEKKYQPCSDDARCKYCRRGQESRRHGVSHWTLAESVANQLRRFEVDMLGGRCGACGLGTVKVEEFLCPNCKDVLEVDDPTMPVRCFTCGGNDKTKRIMVEPQESLICTKGCQAPSRLSLADTWIVVTKSGSGTSTTFNFAMGTQDPFPPDAGDLIPVDFLHDEDFQPVSAHEQAAVLNVKNPFQEPESAPAREAVEDIPFKRAPGFTLREPETPFRR